MPDAKKCQVCGADLPADSPGGNCVHCLLELALGGRPQEVPLAPQPAPAPKLSPGLELAWAIAGTEAVKTRHQLIEPEHLFAGVCKFLAATQAAKPQETKTGQDLAALKAEAAALAAIFAQFTIHHVELYRQLRTRLGHGGFERSHGVKISRSPASRALFARAIRLAAGTPTVTTVHLVNAMLADEHGPLARLLREKGPEVEAMKEGFPPEPTTRVVLGRRFQSPKKPGILRYVSFFFCCKPHGHATRGETAFDHTGDS